MRLSFPSLLALLALGTPVAAQTQTLGPWTVSPPDDASLISGGGVNFTTISVNNVNLSIQEAFTGLPLDEDGYANALTATTLEFLFQAGITNGAGDDLVIFDARFDPGDYSISSDYDGYVATTSALNTNGTLVSTQAYYYQGNGPFTAGVYGIPVDLTALGVPAGAMVNGIRATSTNAACDPVGLGKIVRGPTLTVAPLPLVAGAAASLSVSGATPSSSVGFAFSKTGPGPNFVPIAGCGVVTLDMSAPIKLITVRSSNAAGDVSLVGTAPAGLSGATLYMQAFDRSSCTPTNMVTAQVL